MVEHRGRCWISGRFGQQRHNFAGFWPNQYGAQPAHSAAWCEVSLLIAGSRTQNSTPRLVRGQVSFCADVKLKGGGEFVRLKLEPSQQPQAPKPEGLPLPAHAAVLPPPPLVRVPDPRSDRRHSRFPPRPDSALLPPPSSSTPPAQ